MILPPDFKETVAENRRNLDSNQKPLIEIQSEAGDSSEIDHLGLDWELTKADESGLAFKIFYENPLEVS